MQYGAADHKRKTQLPQRFRRPPPLVFPGRAQSLGLGLPCVPRERCYHCRGRRSRTASNGMFTEKLAPRPRTKPLFVCTFARKDS